MSHPNVPFAFGADPDSKGNGGIPLNGQIALARLYSKALSSSEVLAAYNEFSNRTKLEQVNALFEELGKVKEVLLVRMSLVISQVNIQRKHFKN